MDSKGRGKQTKTRAPSGIHIVAIVLRVWWYGDSRGQRDERDAAANAEFSLAGR